ncbi:hypothetical protein [Chlamydia sp. 17-3921]|uniref:hypothetical protein n=1 Tax=Chlamydia sp. 17-3921 TaxID=2675798 RepID=UPI00191923E5|nr:hypothetical protein [Chlamydia sp. 17-3921]
MKAIPTVSLITAQTPKHPVIRDNEEGVCMMHFLPPYTTDEEGTPLKNKDLLNLKERLSKDCWEKCWQTMLEKQVPATWEEFVWESEDPDPTKDPQKLALAWSPWGHYQKDLDIIRSRGRDQVSSHAMPFMTNTKESCIKYYTKLFKELASSGISKVHFTAPEIFLPEDWQGRKLYHKAVKFTLQEALLMGFSAAFKEILREKENNPTKEELPIVFTLYLTHSENNPLNKD